MRSYLAQIRISLKLTLRDRLVLFFNYAFPLVFFFIFAQTFGASHGGVINQVVAMVLIIGVLGNGFFGAGIRAVLDRELNILRRFKVAPISPLPLLAASMVTGWVHYLPSAILILGAAHLLYGMPVPERWLSLAALLTIGIISFRAVGLIIASVVNSMQESQIVIQLFYLPMLFLSGATFPVTSLPSWLQVTAQFLPASHLFAGMQGIMVRKESLADNLPAVGALVVTAVLATLLSVKLFRWEKEEKVRASAKMWLAAVLAPFLVLGAWQAHTRDNIRKARIVGRDMRRGHTLLIRDARVFTCSGRTIESGAVLVRDGRIAAVWEGQAPDPADLRAGAIEASGKTLLPGLIDTRVYLAQSGGPSGKNAGAAAISRALAAYLYCGITAVSSAPGGDGPVAHAGAAVASGELLGAELFVDEAREGAAVISLTAAEARDELLAGKTASLDRSLVQQAGPIELIRGTREWLLSLHDEAARRRAAGAGASLEEAAGSLRAEFHSSRRLVVGTGSGQPLLIHGPALHRELQLWVRAGVPPAAALEAATVNAAQALGAGHRLGAIRVGHEATLLLVDGNPLADISATERISMVLVKGEQIDRGGLFEESSASR